MHTVVFGWFGGSAVWFIPLLWRLVKSALPGGAGLRGPGTIRLWLGFVCVMVASCTLEASLIAATGVNGFGHALAAGVGHLLGHIGTPLAALALLVISLPWLIDFRWRDVALWADGAFGLGLSRGLAKRDEEARRHRSVVDDGLPSHVSPATNTMAPKSNGRYARPTVWRPPVSGRGAGGRVAADGTGAVGSPGSAAGKDAATRGAGANWRAAASTRRQAAQTEAVLRTGTATPPRHVPMQTQAQPLKADKAAWMPTEPVAPAGWLRETTPRTAASAAGVVAGVASSSSAAAAQATAAQAARVATDTAASGAANAAGNSIANSAAGVGRPSTIPGAASAGTPIDRSTMPRQPFSPAPRANDGASMPATHRPASTAPSYTRPMPTAQKVTPPAGVQETLRSIAENAARWTDIAGVSLARSSGADSVKAATAPGNAVPSIEEAGQSSAGSPPVVEVATTSASAPGAHAPSQNVTDEAAPDYPSVQAPADTPRMGAGADAPSGASNEPVVRWPIEPPVIRPPLTSAPVTAQAHVPPSPPASAPAHTDVPPSSAALAQAPSQTSQHSARTTTPTPFQVFAVQLQASDAQTDASSLEDDSTPFAATAGSHSGPHAEPAQPVGQPANHSQVTVPKVAAATTTADAGHVSELHTEGAQPFNAPVPPSDTVAPQVAVDAAITTPAGNSHADAARPFSPSTALSQTSAQHGFTADDPAETAHVAETVTVGAEPVGSPALSNALSPSAASNAVNLAAASLPQSIASHASNVVRFPGFAVRAEPLASAAIVDEPVGEPVVASGHIKRIQRA